ncbi:MAG: hypothetical protein K8T26_12415 [Lentisphaerae bacterium]|nr:hypothetical protein [Lentisphaerota bacterium]
MPRRRDLWHGVERLAHVPATRADWRVCAGAEAQVAFPLLTETGGAAACLTDEDGERRAVHEDRGGYVVGEFAEDDPVTVLTPVAAADVMTVELDLVACSALLFEKLGVTPAGSAVGVDRMLWCGSITVNGRRVRVGLCFSPSIVQAGALVDRWVLENQGISVILTPTYHDVFEQACTLRAVIYVPLEECLRVANGRVEAFSRLDDKLQGSPIFRKAQKRDGQGACVFESMGATCRIRMPSGVFTIDTDAGLAYLGWFIRHAGEETDPLDLYTQVKGVAAGGGPVEDYQEPVAPIKKAADVNARLDSGAMKAYRERLREIGMERARAEADGDTVRQQELEDESSALEAELTGNVGIGGRVRRFTDDAGKKAEAIRRAVNRTFERISHGTECSQAREEFVAEMRQGLHIGKLCGYTPSAGVVWEAMR